jgi:integration host factor subunit beta
MTKSELIARLAERFPQLVAKDADFAVKMILDALTSALVKGDRIEIRGFGSFALNYRPPRIGRNPKSGDKVQVPQSTCPISRPARNCGSGSITGHESCCCSMLQGGTHGGCRFLVSATAFNADKAGVSQR